LDELRRKRRAIGAKSENAEKKLAKMGPENKGLPLQTDLLEKLRTEMRQVNEECRLGSAELMGVDGYRHSYGGVEARRLQAAVSE